MDAIAPVASEFSFATVVQCDRTENDYIGQQITKLKASIYAPYDIITHIDSDCIIATKLDASDLLENNKPILYMSSYEKVGGPGGAPWQEVTSFFAGKHVDWEFMRQFPMSYPREMYTDLANWFESYHGFPLEGIVDRIDANHFSEFNLMGAFSFYSGHDYHRFRDTEVVAPPSWIRQFWANEFDDRRIVDAEMEEIIAIFGRGGWSESDIYKWATGANNVKTSPSAIDDANAGDHDIISVQVNDTVEPTPTSVSHGLKSVKNNSVSIKSRVIGAISAVLRHR